MKKIIALASAGILALALAAPVSAGEDGLAEIMSAFEEISTMMENDAFTDQDKVRPEDALAFIDVLNQVDPTAACAPMWMSLIDAMLKLWYQAEYDLTFSQNLAVRNDMDSMGSDAAAGCF